MIRYFAPKHNKISVCKRCQNRCNWKFYPPLPIIEAGYSAVPHVSPYACNMCVYMYQVCSAAAGIRAVQALLFAPKINDCSHVWFRSSLRRACLQSTCTAATALCLQKVFSFSHHLIAICRVWKPLAIIKLK